MVIVEEYGVHDATGVLNADTLVPLLKGKQNHRILQSVIADPSGVQNVSEYNYIDSLRAGGCVVVGIAAADDCSAQLDYSHTPCSTR
jgi:hypothetical protein